MQGPRPTKFLKDTSFQISSIAALPPFNNANSLRARQNTRAGKTNEQPMLDNPRYGGQQSRQPRGIGYASEMGIDNPVAAIGDKNVTVFALSDHHLPGNAAFRKCLADGASRRRQAERNDLNRQWKATQNIDPFGVVGDHDHAIRRAGT